MVYPFLYIFIIFHNIIPQEFYFFGLIFRNRTRFFRINNFFRILPYLHSKFTLYICGNLALTLTLTVYFQVVFSSLAQFNSINIHSLHCVKSHILIIIFLQLFQTAFNLNFLIRVCIEINKRAQ